MKKTVFLQKLQALLNQVFSPFLLFFIFSLFLNSTPSFADSVRSVSAEGLIETVKDKRYLLAGIELVPEGYPILLTLLAGQDISVQKAPDLDALEAEAKYAYIYVKVRETMLPAEIRFEFRENRVMVNELLVSFGAARVMEADFKRKPRFLELEDLARLKGEGLWSYSQIELLEEAGV